LQGGTKAVSQDGTGGTPKYRTREYWYFETSPHGPCECPKETIKSAPPPAPGFPITGGASGAGPVTPGEHPRTAPLNRPLLLTIEPQSTLWLQVPPGELVDSRALAQRAPE
jgi:hypothetical protein